MDRPTAGRTPSAPAPSHPGARNYRARRGGSNTLRPDPLEITRMKPTIEGTCPRQSGRPRVVSRSKPPRTSMSTSPPTGHPGGALQAGRRPARTRESMGDHFLFDVTVTVAVLVPPRPSLTVYVKVSVPVKRA